MTVDLNGYRIAHTASAGSCIVMSGAASANITIRNGTIFGGQRGIYLAGTSINGLTIEDVRILGARYEGIFGTQSGNRNFQISRCRVSDTGVTTTASDPSVVVTGIFLGGDAHHIDQCTVSRLYSNGTGGAVRGIALTVDGANSGCLVSRCLVNHDANLTGTGMQFGGFTVYRDNTVMNFTTPYSAAGATNGGGNV